MSLVLKASPAAAIADEALALLRDRRGVDLFGYRRGTIERRLANRMLSVGARSGADYLAVLLRDEAEADRLLERLTIKVSRFYRNAEVFDTLRRVVLPELGRRFGGARLRAWSAGCGEGEEAYTLVMLLEPLAGTVWGTDLDGSALGVARARRYPRRSFEELPPELAAAHLDPDPLEPGHFVVAESLGRRVTFERRDLLTMGAPGPGTHHLVCCRNVLIYLEPALQRRLLARLIGAVVPGGVLVLGEAEWVSEDAGELETIDRRLKLFRRRLPPGERPG